MNFQVHQVPASVTWELRQSVLRPHEAVGDMALPDDDEISTASIAALSEDGEVLGTARVALSPAPVGIHGVTSSDATSWRLRGMATQENFRGRGIGEQVLSSVISFVSKNGGGLLWCNARVPAIDFYRRGGFVEHGDIWIDPDIGPHMVMWQIVQSDGIAQVRK